MSLNIQEIELEWSQLLRHNSPVFCLDYQKTFDSLLKEYEKALTLDPKAAHEQNLDVNLWQKVLLKVIDAYRKELSALAKRGSDSKKLLDEFHGFLLKLTGFLHQLISRLAMKYRVLLIKAVVFGRFDDFLKSDSQIALSDAELACIEICQRLLVFSGDVARYKSQALQTGITVAVVRYEQALYLLPDNGTPFNQLAVISLSKGDSLSAAYFYFRSLMTEKPFVRAPENLQMFFKKIVDKARQRSDPLTNMLKFHALLNQGAKIEARRALDLEFDALWEDSDWQKDSTLVKLTLISLSSVEAMQVEDLKQMAVKFLLKLLSRLLQIDAKVGIVSIRYILLWLLQHWTLARKSFERKLAQKLCEALNHPQNMNSAACLYLKDKKLLRGFRPLDYVLKNLPTSFEEPEIEHQCASFVAIGKKLTQNLAEFSIVWDDIKFSVSLDGKPSQEAIISSEELIAIDAAESFEIPQRAALTAVEDDDDEEEELIVFSGRNAKRQNLGNARLVGRSRVTDTKDERVSPVESPVSATPIGRRSGDVRQQGMLFDYFDKQHQNEIIRLHDQISFVPPPQQHTVRPPPGFVALEPSFEGNPISWLQRKDEPELPFQVLDDSQK